MAEDARVGDRGIVMMNLSDSIDRAKRLFAMDAFTVIAYTERELFHRLLQKLTPSVYNTTEKVAATFPEHLWRIYGPEVATEPYLPRSFLRSTWSDTRGRPSRSCRSTAASW